MSARPADLTRMRFIDPHLRSGNPGTHREIVAADPRPLEVASTSELLQDLRIVGAGTTWTVKEWLRSTHATSLLVLRDGRLVHEWYAERCDQHTLFLGASMTKSALAHLIGVAVTEGVLDLDDAVTTHVPELSDGVSAGGYAGARVGDVLTMTTGADWVEDHRDPDGPASRLVRTFVDGTEPSRALLTSVAPDVGPRRRFAYSTADSQVLDWIRERATGQDFISAMTDLWTRVGATEAAVVGVDRDGVAMAGGGLAATGRDWARLGVLALDGTDGTDGTAAANHRILDHRWVEAVGVPEHDFSAPGYLPSSISGHVGFARHWWPLESSGRRIAADGSRGQFIYVDRDRGVVVVKTSLWPHEDPEVDRQCRDLSYLGLQAIAET